MKTGIVVALPEELSTLTSAKIDTGDCVVLAENLIVALSGTGPENAGRTAGLLIDQGARQLLSWGCAAALSPDLHPGDLVLAKTLCAQDKQHISCDPHWLAHTASILQGIQRVRIGKITSSASIVSTRAAKQALYRLTEALALDMESYAVAETALQSTLPCLALRTVADPAAMDLPDAVGQALNTRGDIDKFRLFRHLLTHPWELPGLISLGKNFSLARNSLKLISQYLDKIAGFHSSPNTTQ